MEVSECKNCGEKKENINLDNATLSLIREKQPICKQCVSDEMKTEFPCIGCLDGFTKSKMNTIGRSNAEDAYGPTKVKNFLKKMDEIYTEIDENVSDDDNVVVCDDCYGEFLMCDICETSVHSSDAEIKTNRRGRERRDYVFHDTCLSESNQFADCNSCGGFLNNETATIIRSQEDNLPYCDECYYEKYSTCESCGDEVESDYAMFCEEAESTMCQECFNTHCSSDSDIESIKEKYTEPDKSSLPSVSTNIISRFEKQLSSCLSSSQLPTFSNSKTDDLKERINAELERMISSNNKKGRDELFALRNIIFDEGKFNSSGARQLLEKVNVDAVVKNEFTSAFPKAKPNILNKINNLNFIFKIVKNYFEQDKRSFTIAVFPPENFRTTCLNVFMGMYPDMTKEYLSSKIDETFSSFFISPHHRGAIGYVRTTFDSNLNAFVINNFQQDSDYQSFSSRGSHDELSIEIARWIDRQISETWAYEALLQVKKLAGSNGVKNIYMTSFETQKERWPKLPQRSSDIYDRIPKNLGAEQETVKTKLYDMGGDTFDLWKLSRKLNRGKRLVKISKLLMGKSS